MSSRLCHFVEKKYPFCIVANHASSELSFGGHNRPLQSDLVAGVQATLLLNRETKVRFRLEVGQGHRQRHRACV